VVKIDVEHVSFDEYWEPFALGVGPAGAYLASLGDEHRAAVRERCRTALSDGPFALSLRAWAVRGVRARSA
jgi:hypothetical protein